LPASYDGLQVVTKQQKKLVTVYRFSISNHVIGK